MSEKMNQEVRSYHIHIGRGLAQISTASFHHHAIGERRDLGDPRQRQQHQHQAWRMSGRGRQQVQQARDTRTKKPKTDQRLVSTRRQPRSSFPTVMQRNVAERGKKCPAQRSGTSPAPMVIGPSGDPPQRRLAPVAVGPIGDRPQKHYQRALSPLHQVQPSAIGRKALKLNGRKAPSNIPCVSSQMATTATLATIVPPSLLC